LFFIVLSTLFNSMSRLANYKRLQSSALSLLLTDMLIPLQPGMSN